MQPEAAVRPRRGRQAGQVLDA